MANDEPPKARGDETAMARSLALVRRPWVVVALIAFAVAVAAGAFVAGRAASSTRVGFMPAPVLAPAQAPAVLKVGDTAAAALPSLARPARKAHTAKAAKKHQISTARASSTPPASTPPAAPAHPATKPGYTIVGG
jgi:hypothetical protein